MALDKCIKTVRDAAPDLTKEDALNLLEEVNDIVNNLKNEEKVVNLQEKVDEAIQKRVDDSIRDAAIKKRNAAINYRTRLAFITKLQNTPTKELPRMLEAILAGEMGKSKYKLSIESTGRGLASMAIATFNKGVEARGVPRNVAIRFLRDKTNGKFLMQDVDYLATKGNSDVASQIKPSGNKTSLAIAESMEEANELLRKQANKSGADISRIIGRIVKQSHDGIKIYKAGFEKWFNDISPLLDEDRTFGRPMSAEERYNFLSEVYDTIVSGKRNDIHANLDEAPGFVGVANMGKRLSHSRSLHFKQDGESAWKYMNAYGYNHIGSVFANSLLSMSDSVAAMMHLGPNPRAMLKEFLQRAQNTARDAKDRDTLAKLTSDVMEKRLNALFDEISGVGNQLPKFGSGMSYHIARISNWLKNLSSSALLGGVPIASVGDIGTSGYRLNEIGENFFRAHLNSIGGLIPEAVGGKGGRRSGQAREIADSLGVGMDALTSSVQSRWIGNDVSDGQGASMVSWLMRVTGMNWMNDSLKTAAGLTLSNFIAKQSGKKFADLDVSLRSEMEAYGLGADDFKLMNSVVQDVDGVKYHDITAIDDIDARIRINGFFTGFVNSAILTPGARAKMTLRFGERGTFGGEFSNLFFHLKSFSVTYGMEMLSRGFSKSNEGNRVGALISMILTSMAYGYLAATLKDLAKGKQPVNIAEKPGQVMLLSLMHGGGLGFYGDLLYGFMESSSFNKGLLETAGGPVIGQLASLPNIVKNIAEGDFDRAAQGGYRVAKSFLPGANIWYTRMAVDYLIFWQMSEYLNPGWARRFERRIREETGQEFMDLGQVTGIDALPDLSPTAAVR
tara:strand:- start:46 stop:2580 length:2535 start_codon:yes stop_codon:yes gene_type:complete